MTCTWQLLFLVAVAAVAGSPQSQEAQCSDQVTPLPEEQMLLQRTRGLEQSSMEESSGSQCKKWCKPNVDKGKFTWGQLCFAPFANKTCGGCTECADAEEPLCGVGTFIEFGNETTCEACPTGRFTAVPGVTKCKRCKGEVSDDGAKCTKKGGFNKLAPSGPLKDMVDDVLDYWNGDSEPLEGGKKGKASPISLGIGHCSGAHVYASPAWELANSSGGTKGIDTDEYASWVIAAQSLCLERNAQTKFISVWTDAGYRCYANSSCSVNGYSNITSWNIQQAASKPKCVDTDDVADSYGTTCAGYTENPDFCAYSGDDEDFTASEMCCACGKKQQEEWLEDREEDDFVIDES